MEKPIVRPTTKILLQGLFVISIICFMAGLTWGITQSYIASDAVEYLLGAIIPGCAGALYLVLYFKKDVAGGPSLFRTIQQRSGYTKAIYYFFSGTLLFVGFTLVLGNLGWKPLIAYPAKWCAGQPTTMEANFIRELGTRPYFGSLGRVEIHLATSNRNVKFAWPKRSISMMSNCRKGGLLISGVSNQFGVVVDDIRCQIN